jgi:hypothetical protein
VNKVHIVFLCKLRLYYIDEALNFMYKSEVHIKVYPWLFVFVVIILNRNCIVCTLRTIVVNWNVYYLMNYHKNSIYCKNLPYFTSSNLLLNISMYLVLLRCFYFLIVYNNFMYIREKGISYFSRMDKIIPKY